MIGRNLRQYRITASLGSGGMGEVWRARDTTLERDVAIKTLPAADDDDVATRKERFFREARAASALNHPNIITIYEINTDQDVDFIAMEYVDGRTLADVLQQGPLPIDQVRRLAQQIADAVGQAHHAGVVHRDLKPRNIMVTKQGLVKVLDFGLAKLTRADVLASNVVTQPALTRVGTTVGTVGYMSPEQAIGDPVDARTDVFSFGVILFEMLTGQLPFTGETMSEVLRKLHFTEPPPIESLRADVPAALRTIVTRALRKQPTERFANLLEVASALNAKPSTAAARTRKVAAPPAMLPARSNRTRAGIVAAVVIVLAVVAAVAVRQSRRHVVPRAAITQGDTPVSSAEPAVTPAVTSIDPPAAPTAPARAPAKAAAPVESGRTSSGHLHWGRLGDAYRSEGRQADAVTAYRRGIALLDEQLANNAGDADLESWRALYLAKLGDRPGALAAIDSIAQRPDLRAPVVFRLAVASEVAGARQRALLGVSRAVRAGYPPKEVLSEPELAALRADPRFQRLAAATQPRKRPRQ